MICGFVGFYFEGMMRVSYAEAAGNSVTFPSFTNSSPLCAKRKKKESAGKLFVYRGYAVRRSFFKTYVVNAREGFFSLVVCHLGPFVACYNQVAELWTKLVLSFVQYSQLQFLLLALPSRCWR